MRIKLHLLEQKTKIMINLQSSTTAATAIAGLLTIGAIAWAMPTSASEILIAQTGAAQHLENIEEKDASEWRWEVGGQNGDVAENQEADYQIRKSNNLFDLLQISPRTQEWENTNSGDSKNDSTTVPVVGF